MPPKESAETQLAIYLHETRKMPIAIAAGMAHIHPGTLRRALTRRGKWTVKKRLDRNA